jgi:hypothetical protein
MTKKLTGLAAFTGGNEPLQRHPDPPARGNGRKVTPWLSLHG